MPQSFDSIILHLVFSTKERKPMLQNEFRSQMHAYLAKVGRAFGSKVFKVGGVADHVHLAVTLSRTSSVADLVRELKTESSKWAKVQSGDHKDFAWQSGYGVFSVSRSKLPVLEAYILNQEKHHEAMSFQEEFSGGVFRAFKKA